MNAYPDEKTVWAERMKDLDARIALNKNVYNPIREIQLAEQQQELCSNAIQISQPPTYTQLFSKQLLEKDTMNLDTEISRLNENLLQFADPPSAQIILDLLMAVLSTTQLKLLNSSWGKMSKIIREVFKQGTTPQQFVDFLVAQVAKMEEKLFALPSPAAPSSPGVTATLTSSTPAIKILDAEPAEDYETERRRIYALNAKEGREYVYKNYKIVVNGNWKDFRVLFVHNELAQAYGVTPSFSHRRTPSTPTTTSTTSIRHSAVVPSSTASTNVAGYSPARGHQLFSPTMPMIEEEEGFGLPTNKPRVRGKGRVRFEYFGGGGGGSGKVVPEEPEGVREIPDYVVLNKYRVSINHLKQNLITIKYAHKCQSIPGFPKQICSNPVKEMFLDLLLNRKFSREKYDAMDRHDQAQVYRILDKCHLDVGLPEPEKTQKEYEILLGEFRANNQNPQIKAKLRSLINEQILSKGIPMKQGLLLLAEIG